MDMNEIEKRWRINELCYSIPQDAGLQCKCPYNDDMDCWCHNGRVADIPADKLDEVLKKLEGVCHA